ncbi:MAG TPA: DUF1127 domain-containing protein [Rhodospirillales bacterium]|jgi:uncharacterized protein YjiS (DUF1127 family)|nr:DUF1127 domain-containing protein [Rhodospirillales bacterium]HJO69795.1 DUF1127 domain-containing protein [Rhodospirillales bacterium]
MSLVEGVLFACTPVALRVPALTRLVGALARAADTIDEWHERARQRHRLATLDARMLADIGVTRAEALSEADRPFWQA